MIDVLSKARLAIDSISKPDDVSPAHLTVSIIDDEPELIEKLTGSMDGLGRKFNVSRRADKK